MLTRASRCRGGISGTRSSTGRAKIANHSAETRIASRTSKAPPSAPNGTASSPWLSGSPKGWRNSTNRMRSSTIPPTYPMPQPKPETLPIVFGVETCTSIAL